MDATMTPARRSARIAPKSPTMAPIEAVKQIPSAPKKQPKPQEAAKTHRMQEALQTFERDLDTLVELCLHSQEKLQTSAQHRKTYFAALERCTCVLRDIAYEVSHKKTIIEDRKDVGMNTAREEQLLVKMKTYMQSSSELLLSCLDETRKYRQSHHPADDPLDSIDASENETAIREYIKEICGF